MRAEVFQTLGDPNRLRIVTALRGGERAVSELVDVLDIHQSGVSRHLSVLQEAGFVTVRKDGPRRIYALSPAPFHELEAFIDEFRGLWEARLDRFAKALKQRQAAKAAAPTKKSPTKKQKKSTKTSQEKP